MNNAISQMVLAAAGTGLPTNPTSRYYGATQRAYTLPGGTQVQYIGRRIIPSAAIYPSVRRYVVVDGDRLDNLAAKFLGDPLLFWMICDANGAVDPDSLTAQVGRSILIPLPSGIPAGARSG